MLILPSQLIAFFGGHADFSNSAALVVLLAPGVPLIGVDMILGSALAALDKQRQWTAVGVAAAVLNPLVNLAAIPYTQVHFGNGAIGAAGVTSLTELFMMVMGLRLLPHGVLDRSTVLGVLRILAVCLPMAAVAWLARNQPLPVSVFAGGSVYVVSLLVTRTISREDLGSVVAHLLRRQRLTVEGS
jgi:O-antigen/teichoic acid export membrane protein